MYKNVLATKFVALSVLVAMLSPTATAIAQDVNSSSVHETKVYFKDDNKHFVKVIRDQVTGQVTYKECKIGSSTCKTIEQFSMLQIDDAQACIMERGLREQRSTVAGEDKRRLSFDENGHADLLLRKKFTKQNGLELLGSTAVLGVGSGLGLGAMLAEAGLFAALPVLAIPLVWLGASFVGSVFGYVAGRAFDQNLANRYNVLSLARSEKEEVTVSDISFKKFKRTIARADNNFAALKNCTIRSLDSIANVNGLKPIEEIAEQKISEGPRKSVVAKEALPDGLFTIQKAAPAI